ncbi:hypothetical protein D4764_07G0001600 [Takifugu flavidus]|uniref:Alkylated DNA repair protein AlkB homologue 8 N-terminal domain-containing protein n=1 Tax=Takifugu flavidus TaxID=433684 RepID=A0A5C6MTH9_9TELE|nr:hypothetical protein D4764_07G0001600 [Takifugu flavidus]
MIIDFRRRPPQYPPLTINGAVVERESSTEFLGVHISEDLTWTTDTAQLARKAQTHLYFLCKLRRAYVPPPSLNGASKIIHVPLLSLANIFRIHFTQRAISIVEDNVHPSLQPPAFREMVQKPLGPFH